MKIDVLTLFPSMFDDFLKTSIIGKAITNKKVIVNVHNFRDFSSYPNKQVDDYGFGGGQGMVLMPEPLFKAVEHLKEKDSLIIMMTPQGKTYNQEMAYNLSQFNHLIIICGHYEGFDERIRTLVDLEISIGDYILTGGEIPSMVIIDSIVRLLDGIILESSHINETFNNNLLDYPVYTKPREFRGMKVPEVLLSGHHENIRKWREQEAYKKTLARRPDLLEKSD